MDAVFGESEKVAEATEKGTEEVKKAAEEVGKEANPQNVNAEATNQEQQEQQEQQQQQQQQRPNNQSSSSNDEKQDETLYYDGHPMTMTPTKDNNKPGIIEREAKEYGWESISLEYNVDQTGI